MFDIDSVKVLLDGFYLEWEKNHEKIMGLEEVRRGLEKRNLGYAWKHKKWFGAIR